MPSGRTASARPFPTPRAACLPQEHTPPNSLPLVEHAPCSSQACPSRYPPLRRHRFEAEVDNEGDETGTEGMDNEVDEEDEEPTQTPQTVVAAAGGQL